MNRNRNRFVNAKPQSREERHKQINCFPHSLRLCVCEFITHHQFVVVEQQLIIGVNEDRAVAAHLENASKLFDQH
jgi:hypothetical protein